MMFDAMVWQTVPFEVERLAQLAAPYAETLPRDGRLVWFEPQTADRFDGSGLPEGFGERPWLPIKTASSGAFRPLFDIMQLTPNKFNKVFGGPTPLAGMLAGGLLGSGLGYGAGWLGEKLLGSNVLEPGRLRRAGLIAGGGLGALPGLYLGAVGARLKREDGAGWGKALGAFFEPNVLFGKEGMAREMREALDEIVPHEDPYFRKSAEDAGSLFMPTIPVDSFNRTVWRDPNTPLPIRAATTGLVESASQSRGGSSLVSPFDVGRIAVGMGSGLVSGMLVGKVLGSLAGLTPQAQNTLKQTGMWAGVLSAVVPKAFGF